MKNLIIVGAGGYGREVYNFALNSLGYKTEYAIKGFLDTNKNILDGFIGYPPILGEESTYDISKNDIFICAVGNNKLRKAIVEKILARGGNFITLIHETAIIHTNVKIGIGCIIQPFSCIGSDVFIGNHTIIQNNVVIGHDATVGSFSRIDCHSTCVGGVNIEDFVTVYTSSVISHKVTLYTNSVVAACSFVIKSVKTGTTVYGNPAVEL